MSAKLTGWAKQIADVLQCGSDVAEAVFDEMCASGFDFSEATVRQFKRECRMALAVVTILEG